MKTDCRRVLAMGGAATIGDHWCEDLVTKGVRVTALKHLNGLILLDWPVLDHDGTSFHTRR